MLAHPTLDQLHTLGLHGLTEGFSDSNTSPKRVVSITPNG